MNRWLTSAVGLLMAWSVGSAQVENSNDYARLGRPTAAAPAASLGRPRVASQDTLSPPTHEPVRQVAFDEPTPPPPAAIFRAQISDDEPPPPFSPPDDSPPARLSSPSARSDSRERFLSGQPERRPTYRPTDRPSTSRYNHTSRSDDMFPIFDGWGEQIGRHGPWFQSDHCFEYMISPVTNPFLFEDPRSLTEIRPIFMYQRIPSNNPVFRGGNAEFYGTQLRVAFTDRFSFVVNELGAVVINPGTGAQVPGGSGFAELRLGPKFTFLRSTEYRAVGAMGLTFDIPTGPSSVYQNTGNLSLTPYVTVGKNFFECEWGSFNVLDTLGYSFATDSIRTNMFFNSLHLDFDVLNRHRFFPLLELNWFNYSRSGTAHPFGTEGADLANIGSMGVGGKNNLLLAVGMRYKFSEHLQAGIATEFPLLDRRDLNNFRLTIDLIWRY